MTDTKLAPASKANLTAWQPGQSGNPKGRPKGSRNKLGEDFVRALHEDFVEHGVEVIEKVRHKHPKDYLKIIAHVIPAELDVRVTAQFTDAELLNRIRQLASELGVGSGGTPRTIDGVAEAPRAKPDRDLSPVH